MTKIYGTPEYAKFGFVPYNGITYQLTNQAELTNRVFPGWWGDVTAGEEYTSEWSAAGCDADDNEVVVTWQFDLVRNEEPEPDTYDWGSPSKVVFA
jgi:hypothetical protein